MHHPTDRIAHTTAFVTPVVEHWLEREIAQWVQPWRIDPTTHRTTSERSYHGATSRSACATESARGSVFECSSKICHIPSLSKEGNILFNDALNTFYLRLYGGKEGKMFYLTTPSTHFIYGYMEVRKEMFYLTTRSTHFIYGYMEGRKCFI